MIELETDRLKLRQFTPAHLDELAAGRPVRPAPAPPPTPR